MHQEPPDELVRLECHGLVAAGSLDPVVLVAERYASRGGGDEAAVPGRSPELNRRIAGHEIGHAFVGRCLGSHVHFVTIIPSGGFAGRCVRSGAPSSWALNPEAPE